MMTVKIGGVGEIFRLLFQWTFTQIKRNNRHNC
uniref:Uncharacterized protein n=1 Tax=Tetranychus urticae TaxID=32264 RepID=T1KM87_TETUR